MAAYPEMPIDFAFLKEEEDRLRERLLAGEAAPEDFLQEVTPELQRQMTDKRKLAATPRRLQMQPNLLLGSGFWFSKKEEMSAVPAEDLFFLSEEDEPPSLSRSAQPPLSHCAQFAKYFLEPLPPHMRQHLLLAGGAVVDELLGRKCVKDWDFFLVGLGDKDPEAFVLELLHLWEPYVYYGIRTQHSLTLRMSTDNWSNRFTVQIVLRVYRSPVEVLTGFDVDASACGFYENRFWVTPRSRHALETGLLCLDLDRMSTTYNQRLVKYMYQKGFDLLLPVPVEGKHFLLASHPRADEAMKDQRLLQCSLVGLIYLTIFKKRKRLPTALLVDSEYCPITAEEFERRGLHPDARDVVRVFFDNDDSLVGYGFPKPLLTPENLLGVDDLFARYKHVFYGDESPTRFRTWFKIGPTSVPDRVQFLTVNPGRQHTASFHPREITLQEWVDMSPLSISS